MDAPVAGATGMMIANTAMPMARPAKPAGRALVDGAEDDEREDERADGLGEEGLSGARHRCRTTATPRPTSDALLPSTPMMAQRAGDGADHLRADVAGHIAPGHLAGGGQRDRDGRVDLASGDVADRVDHADDHEHERERDHAELRHRERRVAADDQRRRDRTDADEDEHRGAERLGEPALSESVGLHAGVLPRSPDDAGTGGLHLHQGGRPTLWWAGWCSTMSNAVSVKVGPCFRPVDGLRPSSRRLCTAERGGLTSSPCWGDCLASGSRAGFEWHRSPVSGGTMAMDTNDLTAGGVRLGRAGRTTCRLAETAEPWTLEVDALVVSAGGVLGDLGESVMQALPDPAWSDVEFEGISPGRPQVFGSNSDARRACEPSSLRRPRGGSEFHQPPEKRPPRPLRTLCLRRPERRADHSGCRCWGRDGWTFRCQSSRGW